MIGETTGKKKLDPLTVARQMKVVRVSMVSAYFHTKNVTLSSTQIRSFFSRSAKCRNQDPTLEKDLEAAENEDALTAFRDEILAEMQPKQSSHD